MKLKEVVGFQINYNLMSTCNNILTLYKMPLLKLISLILLKSKN